MTTKQLLLSKGALSAIVAAVSAKLGVLFYVLVLLSVLMIVDFMAGMAASRKESLDHPGDKKYGWSSKKGLYGILKKSGYVLVITVAVVLDCLIFKIVGIIGISMPTTTFFGVLVTVWFILNECLSIIENAGRMGVEGIPDFLTDAISVLKKDVTRKGADCTGATKEE